MKYKIKNEIKKSITPFNLKLNSLFYEFSRKMGLIIPENDSFKS